MTVAMNPKMNNIITHVNWKLVNYLAFVLNVINNKLDVQIIRGSMGLYLMKKNI